MVDQLNMLVLLMPASGRYCLPLPGHSHSIVNEQREAIHGRGFTVAMAGNTMEEYHRENVVLISLDRFDHLSFRACFLNGRRLVIYSRHPINIPYTSSWNQARQAQAD